MSNFAQIGFKGGPLRWFAKNALRRLSPSFRARVIDALLSEPVTVDTTHGPIRFLNHGRGSCKRAKTLLTKEPDSLKWIDAMQPGGVFWDIGANIGTLSIYAAARGDLDVWAFEPAGVNYYNLVANCELNNATEHMHCFQLGFGNRNEIGNLHVSQLMSAHSFTFAKSKKKKIHQKVFSSRQTAMLWTVDALIERYGLPRPNYIKIDVPGLTIPILEGAERTLKRPDVKQLQIEVEEHGRGGRMIKSMLSAYGFHIVTRNMKRNGTVQGDLLFGR